MKNKGLKRIKVFLNSIRSNGIAIVGKQILDNRKYFLMR